MDQITLRAHHGMCIANFRGNGYDEAFTRNMTAVIEQLCRQPETPVTLVQREDILCARCPHNKGGCTSIEKVLQLDAGALAACGLQSGGTIPWKDYQRLVRERILSTELFDSICGGCEWYSLCRGILDGASSKG